MADQDIQKKTVSGLQLITKLLQSVLGPFALPGQEDIRKEYFDSLGIDSNKVKDPKTSNLDAFHKKKAEEADALAFAQAMQELTDIVVNIEDAIQNPNASDITTALINTLALDGIRRGLQLPLLPKLSPHPTIHNAIMVLYALNNFSNKGGGVTPVADMVGNYFSQFGSAFKDIKTPEQARNFSEVLFTLLTVLSFWLNGKIKNSTTNPEVDLTIGGQFGYELERKTTLETPQDIINDLFGRAFTFSYTQTNPSLGERVRTGGSLYFTFLPLDDENNGSGVIVVIEGDATPFKNLKLSENWFVTFRGDGGIAVRVGDTSDDIAGGSIGDLPVKADIQTAFEYLPFPKAMPIADIEIPTLFDIFRLGFGNLSFQLRITTKDIRVGFVAQVLYSVQKGDKKGFPYKYLPDKQDAVLIPLSYSLKNGFAFDGGFIGERPPDKPKLALTALASADSISPPANSRLGTLDIPIHRELGVVRFDKLHLGFDTEQGLGVNLTLDFTLKFGKAVIISIAEMGTSLAARKRTEAPLNGGFLGYDISPRFITPKGAGIVIETAIVKGGGFLYLNEIKGEYYGAIELGLTGLSFFPDTKLGAIGVINTKNLQGQEQFSLLILITAEFLPIQIGFGFTWNGVGGLLALNRTANLPYIQEGLKNGVLQSILFPRDLVANMSRVISDLTTAFPVANDNFVVGLMAKLGFGTPTKVTLDLGLFLDINNNNDYKIVLLGVLKAKLPKEEKVVLSLQAAFIGIYDQKNQFIFFRAELIDSRLLTFKLTGSLALGISWGPASVFVLSAGGFHPRFHEIPSLPTLPNAFSNLQRIGIQLLDSKNPRILVEHYFAMTSNTVQIGGKAELFYDIFSGEGGYNIYGRLEVNALFHFNPFKFILDIAAQIALRDDTDWVMGISIYGLLEGPTPWHLRVKAVVEVFWFLTIEVNLDKTWGDRRPELPPAVAQVSGLLKDAVKDVRNWETKTQQKTTVALRKIEDNEILQLDPSGGLKFSQSVVPLEFNLQKFGEQTPDLKRFAINSVKIGNQALNNTPVRDLFAPEMFVRLTDDERLSRPSFERMLSGFELENSEALVLGSTQNLVVNGEIADTDSPEIAISPKLVDMNPHFRNLVRTSSATYKSVPARNFRARQSIYQHLAPQREEPFVVAGKGDLSPVGNRTFTSFSEAQEFIHKQADSQRQNLQVLERLEVI